MSNQDTMPVSKLTQTFDDWAIAPPDVDCLVRWLAADGDAWDELRRDALTTLEHPAVVALLAWAQGEGWALRVRGGGEDRARVRASPWTLSLATLWGAPSS